MGNQNKQPNCFGTEGFDPNDFECTTCNYFEPCEEESYEMKPNEQREYRVTHAEMSTLPRIIAVDADGTLWKDKFPDIGEIIPYTWDKVREEQVKGSKIILWTCRDGLNLVNAVKFCAEHGLIFDAVNCNITEVQHMFSNDTRKVYANEYWDDKSNPIFSYGYTNEVHKGEFSTQISGTQAVSGLFS